MSSIPYKEKEMEAKDKVTIDIEYDRPVFIFPDLASEQGNPMEYFKLAAQSLKSVGFYREAKELSSFRYSSYETHFNTIARFLDFNSSQTFQEDEEYVYIKIKKNSEETQQPRVFSQNNAQNIRDLIDEGHDFSLTNCYGRHHLHYLTDLPAIKELMEANKEHQWFDLFDLDHFNSTLLHGKRDFPIFSYILNEMYKESPKMAEAFLYGTNIFGHNAFGEFLKACDVMFSPKNSLPSIDKVKELGEVLEIIGKIDPKKRDQFIGLFVVVEKNNPAFKSSEIKPIILNTILQSELPIQESDSDYKFRNFKI